MPSILKPQKKPLLMGGIVLVTLTMLACGNASPPAKSDIVMLTRLPTLTPTALNGNSNAAPPVAATPPAAEAPPGGEVIQPTQPVEAAPIVADPAATPTQPVAPSAESATTTGSSTIVIVALNKVEEYVDIQNISQQDQDLRGWNVYSERDGQKCNLAGTLTPGQTLRIWALASSAAQGGYNCGFSQEIWNDTEADTAILYDPFGLETSRSQ